MDAATLKAYYQLTKPGVMYGNVLTGVAGFLCAASGVIDWSAFIAVIFGMTCVVSSACVVNNYLDRDIDRKMTRTKSRPSVTGAVPPRNILLFGIVLAIIGFAVLSLWTNWLVVLVGAVGFVTYVWLYGAWSKRRSMYGTAVGSVSGAMPILGGYVAASGQFDLGALIVFLIIFFWQFPEFYSIAIYRQKEYAAADVPVITVSHGVTKTVRHIFILTILYVLSTVALVLTPRAGIVYALVMAIVGIYWIFVASKGFKAKDTTAWARQMFKISMYVILVDCVMLSIGGLLP